MKVIRHTKLLFITAMLLFSACVPRAIGSPDQTPDTFTLPEIEAALNTTVVNVIDGVTIEVDIDGQIHTVKYLGLELPDPNQTENGSLVYRQALDFNRFLVEGKSVQLVKGSVESDSLGNLLRYVYVDGEMANETLITNGYARIADFPQSFDFQTAFLLAEENARLNLRGFWNETKTIDQYPFEPSADLAEAPKFGGTLPSLPSAPSSTQVCDFSGTFDPVIKGITDDSGDQLYYLPNNTLYSAIELRESQDDTLFCTEFEAILAGYSEAD